MIEKKAGIDDIENNMESDDAYDANDEMSIADSMGDIRSINVMIYDDVESEEEFEFNIEGCKEETKKLNNNKIQIENKIIDSENNINYFNDYILTPIHMIIECCKKLYSYIF